MKEVQLITNQFSAEFGGHSAGVMSMITKSGTNNIAGSAFADAFDHLFVSCLNLNQGASHSRRIGLPHEVSVRRYRRYDFVRRIAEFVS